MLHIVLVEPQIPPNTGNIARLCAALGLSLHLVEPLGFSTEDRYLKRAGLDYWPHVDLHYHKSLNALKEEYPNARFFYLSKKVKRSYTEAIFHDGDFLVFGSETKGLCETLLEKNKESCLTIPMKQPAVRSLNLSSAVAMVVGEALRQINNETP